MYVLNSTGKQGVNRQTISTCLSFFVFELDFVVGKDTSLTTNYLYGGCNNTLLCNAVKHHENKKVANNVLPS